MARLPAAVGAPAAFLIALVLAPGAAYAGWSDHVPWRRGGCLGELELLLAPGVGRPFIHPSSIQRLRRIGDVASMVEQANREALAVERAFGFPLRAREVGYGGARFVHGIENPGLFPDSITRSIPALKGKEMRDYVFKVGLKEEAKSVELFRRERSLTETLARIPKEKRPLLLETHYYDRGGTRFVIQRELPPGTQSLDDAAYDLLSRAGVRGRFATTVDRAMVRGTIALLVDSAPDTHAQFRYLGVKAEQVRALRASPEVQKLVGEIRLARDFARRPEVRKIADRSGADLSNILAWNDEVTPVVVDFSWQNGRVLPDGRILWFDL